MVTVPEGRKVDGCRLDVKIRLNEALIACKNLQIYVRENLQSRRAD